MTSLSNRIIFVSKIILPSIICAFLFRLFKIDIGYHVLIFGLIIIQFNYNKIKYNFLVSNILSVLLSYITFFISIALYFSIGYIIMQFIELDELDGIGLCGYNLKELIFLVPVAIISPRLMFISYQILFNIKKTKFSKKIQLMTVLSLVLFGLMNHSFTDDYSSIAWQFIMALALQLILYQKELKILIYKKANR